MCRGEGRGEGEGSEEGEWRESELQRGSGDVREVRKMERGEREQSRGGRSEGWRVTNRKEGKK